MAAAHHSDIACNDPDQLQALFAQVWLDDNLRYGSIRQDNASADVVIVPALNRPYHYYYKLAQWLAGHCRANIYIPDRYGGGGMPETGIVRQHCDQLHTFFRESGIDGTSRPLYLFGHSWGGLLALNYLAESHKNGEAPDIAGALLGAPFLRMNARIRVPFGGLLKRLGDTSLGKCDLSLKHNSLAHCYLRVAHPGLFNDSRMATHDPVLQNFEKRHPEYGNTSLNIAQIGEALKQQDWLRRPDVLGHITTPVGIMSAGLEGFICNRENARVADSLPCGWHVSLKGAKHGFMHPDDDVVFKRLQNYIKYKLFAMSPKGVSPALQSSL